VTIIQILSAFAHDDKLKIALVAIFLDFVLGVLAAVKLGNFRFSYVADFMRNDVLYKLVPWFVLYGAATVAGQVDIVIPGLDLGVVAGASYGVILAAWTASILGSLNTLRLAGVGTTQTAATALLAPENAAPPKD
jgi:hypothetical protein